MKILYFAWVREKAGVGEEDIPLPGGVADVNELIQWQKNRGSGYAAAFAAPELIRVAVNQTHVGLDHPLTDGDEVAFFPPVTGG
jgi:molybdopterin synthase sulfur carrier subunit